MKKLVLVLIVVLMLIPFSVFAKSGSFIELSAGSLKVKGEKVGVLSLTPLSYIYQLGMKVPAPALGKIANGLVIELIAKGAKIMELSPHGMEQIIAPFIVVRKGAFSTKEVMSASSDKALLFAMKNKQDLAGGFSVIEKLMDINELSGELGRIDNYQSVYNRILKLWGVTKLITVQAKGTFGCIVKGYEISGPSAALVFQYEVKGDKDNWSASFPVKFKDNWKNFVVNDSSDVKFEQSFKRTVEIVKRISQFLK